MNHVILYYPQNTVPGKGRLPLSVLALGSVLGAEFPYTIIDGNVDPHAFAAVKRLISHHGDRAVLAVSVMPGTQMVNAIQHCQSLKGEFPRLTIIWGGYFPSMHTESVLNGPTIDYVIRGQGEQALPGLLRALDGQGSVSEVPNVSRRDGAAFVHQPSHPIFDLNNRPLFPYHALQMEKYAIPTFVGQRTYCHESSVGCPHSCNFCGVVDVFHSRWKAETPDRTLEVVRHLKVRYGMDGLEFHDSDFFVSEQRVVTIARGLAGWRISWWGEGRIDTMLRYSRSTWELMRRSGLTMIFFGAESGLDETLAMMDKGTVTREKTMAIAALCGEYGVQPEFSFVMGSHPTKTREDIDATVDLMYELRRINPSSQMHPFVYTPVPFGTIYDAAAAGGLQYPLTLEDWLKREWRSFTLRRDPHTPWLTPGLYRRIVHVRAVLQSYAPRINDRTVPRWKARVLRAASWWRYRFRRFEGAYELRLLLRLLFLPPPKHEGF